MTKARDLANIISGGFTESDIPNLSASKITSGTLPDARIADLAATKLTGTIADARVSASSVTQHVTPTDLTPLETDIMILGLHTATNRNASETNLESSHVIRFEDDTKITSETTGDRNATNESWGSIVEAQSSIPVKLLVTGGTTSSSTITDISASPMTVNTNGSPTWTTAAYKYGTNSMLLNGSSQFIYLDDHINFDYNNDSNGFTFEMWWKQVSTTGEDSYGSMPLFGQSGSASNGNPRNYVWRVDGDSIQHYHQGASPDGVSGNFSGATMEDGNWHHIAAVFEHNSGSGKFNIAVDGAWSDGTGGLSSYSPATEANEFKIGRAQASSGSAGYANMYVDSFRLTHENVYTIGTAFTPPTTEFGTTKTVITDNATGTLITTAQTVGSAKTSVSGIVMYKDVVGTNTLGTDLKIYVSANNGTNWVEASSYTAMTPTFNSSGVKMVKLGATTVTSGTQVKVKAVFANQANASKRAEIHGFGLNY